MLLSVVRRPHFFLPHTVPTSMARLYNTLLTALPFLIPIVVLMIARLRPPAWKPQRIFLRLSLGLYFAALGCYAANAVEEGTPMAFFGAFYGTIPDKTPLVFWGYGFVILAIVAMFFVVNWDTVRLFTQRKNASASDERSNGQTK
ncbi:hypothetical protein SUTMEG_15320 [Sutterella megalosphaeroides]|uniref:Uncharacterized protein n=2 Tax=Sutterella megalosphaeroides TaxID=2494234 RepID=A0A2Z6IAU4_9BURK|nr:hypothetical protein SUTMEG_15320 [Sutterella megalosphaeroides]